MNKSVTVLAVAGAFAWMDAALAQAISRVTLYPGSATIERAAKVQPGIGTLELAGLPANFDPRTLRVETDAGIQVGRSQVRRILRAEKVRWRRTRSWATSTDPEFAPKGPASWSSAPPRRPAPR